MLQTGLEVRESGRALKVQSEVPHLVSLGGGRLSTAVTLHPLHEGRLTLGSNNDADILIQGTGVEPTHCQIENKNNIVTLYPFAEMTSVDGVRVMTPTRLAQGSMLCIGRSNYMRFNHPAEARIIRNIMPDARISMVPLNFYNGVENVDGIDRKPPIAPRRSPRDSWGDVSNSSSCNSGSEDCSLKVFPMGSVTVNSPASAVLGPNHPSQINGVKYSESLTNGFLNNGSAFSKSSSAFSTHVTPINSALNNLPSNNNTNGRRSQTPVTVVSQTFNNKSMGMQSEDNRTIAERRLGSMSSLPGINTNNVPSPTLIKDANEYRALTTPSPAFNRNPTSSGRSNVYSPRCVTPSPPKAGQQVIEHRRTLSASSQDEQIRRVSSPTPSYGSNCSMEELTARKEELEQKRKQAQSERLREQEAERNERARLEEILSMCADYERQEQLEKQCKSPGILQNRIKTNGSLPRDKRHPSPGISASEDELIDVFTFDNNTIASSSSTVPSHAVSPLPATARALNGSNLGSIRSPYENVLLTVGGITYPQSPRTRIRTIASKESTPIRDNVDAFESRVALSNDYEYVTSAVPQQSPYINISNIYSQQNNQPTRNSGDKLILPLDLSPTDCTPHRKNSERDKLILPLDMNPADRLSEALEAMKTQNAQRISDRRKSLELKKGIEKQGTQFVVDQSGVDDESHQQNIIMLRNEYESLRKERGKLLAAMSGLKRNITDIEQQEGEVIGELELEQALLDGEWATQNEKHKAEQLRQVELRKQLTQLDQEVAHFSAREVERQAECKTRLEAAEEKVKKSQMEMASCSDNVDKQKLLADQLKTHRDLLDQEKKLFEDLEFRHLEEEANCLAGHEELQRELSEVTQRLESRQIRLAELERQRLEADHTSQLESQGLERQLMNNLRRLEEVRNKLRTIELKLEELSSKGLFSNQDSSPDASSDNDEGVRPTLAQSPEDIARISRVTQGAPLELGTGSLGRKTLESLQTIERNRQLHLVQQGSQVIENERKRVEELKRRVQDEVHAQWAKEQRQREDNCYSLNSVGSDEASSDVPTESASSDETMEKRNSMLAASMGKHEEHELDSANNQRHDSMRAKELEMERNREETRPLTDGSDYEQQLPVSMRDRDKAARLQHQRPLTRYLPIRSESLDLRQHIETAGHQVELCQHVSLDTTSCRGNLHKLGAKFHHWGKRWFVFDRNLRTLTYYSDRTEKKARGGAYFQAIEEVYVDHLNSVKSPNPQLTFVVKTSERTYHLMAPSAEAMRIWVDVVFTGAEGYQEFEHGT